MAIKTTALTAAAALAGAVSMAGIAAPAAAQDQVQCWGVAAAGENGCANAANTHSCAGQSTVDYSYGEWKYVESEEACQEMGGQLDPGEGINEQLAG
ncbi:MAG: DUF2282 domain-containing protein [Alphaproteobacteria bacterium]|jgi:uncharacterized membrane protein|nr:DUF2282 domain-containing protein [Alphaproteobacteria bacterium]